MSDPYETVRRYVAPDDGWEPDRDTQEALAALDELKRDRDFQEQRALTYRDEREAARDEVERLKRMLAGANAERDTMGNQLSHLGRELQEARAKLSEYEDHPPGIGDADIQRVFREREEARAEVERLRLELADMYQCCRDCDASEARAETERLKAELCRIRGPLCPNTGDGCPDLDGEHPYHESAMTKAHAAGQARVRPQVERLKAEVERLRALAADALTLIRENMPGCTAWIEDAQAALGDE